VGGSVEVDVCENTLGTVLTGFEKPLVEVACMLWKTVCIEPCISAMCVFSVYCKKP
jgi:hypothetical protein